MNARSHGVAEAVEPVRALRGGLARQKVACTRVGTEFGCVMRARGLGVWVGNGVLVQTIVCPLAALLLRAALRGSGLVARALLRADLFGCVLIHARCVPFRSLLGPLRPFSLPFY